MHVAIDALSVRRRLCGGGNYIRNLVSSLSKLDASTRFRVYIRPSAAPLFANPGPNVELVLGYESRLIRLLWEQTGLPCNLARHGATVFHGAGLVAPLRQVCPQVITIHDMTWFLLPEKHTFVKRHYFRSVIRLCSQRCGMLIAISESTRNDIIRLLDVPPEKVRVIHLGVDERFRPLSNLHSEAVYWQKYTSGRKIILFVGHIEPRKNLRRLIQAFAQLKDLHHEYCIIAAGNVGWKVDDVLRAPVEFGITELVHFPGFITEEMLPTLYNMAEMFVYPSLYEGFGLPVLEALACGIPTISSAISSMPEVVGDSGILVDPLNVNDLSQAILRLASDSDLRLRLRERGLKRSRLFSWEKMARDTLRVYYELAGRSLPVSLSERPNVFPENVG